MVSQSIELNWIMLILTAAVGILHLLHKTWWRQAHDMGVAYRNEQLPAKHKNVHQSSPFWKSGLLKHSRLLLDDLELFVKLIKVFSTSWTPEFHLKQCNPTTDRKRQSYFTIKLSHISLNREFQVLGSKWKNPVFWNHARHPVVDKLNMKLFLRFPTITPKQNILNPATNQIFISNSTKQQLIY